MADIPGTTSKPIPSSIHLASRSMCVVACIGSPTTKSATESFRDSASRVSGLSTDGRIILSQGPTTLSSRASCSVGRTAVYPSKYLFLHPRATLLALSVMCSRSPGPIPISHSPAGTSSLAIPLPYALMHINMMCLRTSGERSHFDPTESLSNGHPHASRRGPSSKSTPYCRSCKGTSPKESPCFPPQKGSLLQRPS